MHCSIQDFEDKEQRAEYQDDINTLEFSLCFLGIFFFLIYLPVIVTKDMPESLADLFWTSSSVHVGIRKWSKLPTWERVQGRVCIYFFTFLQLLQDKFQAETFLLSFNIS